MNTPLLLAKKLKEKPNLDFGRAVCSSLEVANHEFLFVKKILKKKSRH